MRLSWRQISLALVLAVVLIVAAFPVHSAFADGLSGPIVTKCSAADQAGFSGACQLCDLVTLARQIINFAVAFAVIVATLMFTYAGVLYFTSSAKDNIKKAHGIFVNVLVGLVIILASWLVIDLIMRTLTGQQITAGTFGPWNTFQCQNYPTTQNLPALGELPDVPLTVGSSNGGGGGIAYNADAEQAVRADLATRAGGKIKYNTASICTTPQTSGCTNVGGLTQGARDGLVNLANGCNCDVTITGGTEQGPHATHTGNQVDIRIDDGSLAYIQQHRSELGIDAICTDSAHQQYAYNCSHVESEPHLHLDFGG